MNDSSPRPNTFGRIVYRTLLPACFLVPLWMLFGEHGGWLLILMFMIVPFIALYHIVLFVLAHFGTQKGVVERRTAITIVGYYIAMFFFTISLIDGGDTQESVGSRLTTIGISESVSEAINTTAMIAVLAFMALTVIFFIIDIIAARKAKHNQETPHEISPSI